MERRNRAWEIWDNSDPADGKRVGEVEEFSEESYQTLRNVPTKIEMIQSVLSDHGISLRPNCDLRRFLSELQSDYEEYEQCFDEDGNIVRQYRARFPINACMLDRIHDSILAAKGEKSATEILSHLGKGDVDLLNRSQSKAKDLLWELELFAILKEKGLRPVFAEPDIVVEFDGAMVGVACKKLYSETHVQDVLSKAVRQVAGEMDVGIAAVNLDELLPANCIWRSNTLEEAGRKVARHNNGFRTRHSRHIEKYLASGRLVSVLVSTTALADIVFGRAKFANVGDVSYWSLYGLSDEKAQLLKRFYGMVFG